MSSPVLAVVEGLERGAVEPAALEALGEPDPRKATDQLARAAAHPDLAPSRYAWLPELLTTARPGFAAGALAELADRYRDARGAPLDLKTRPAVVRVLGSSDFLARLLLRHAHWTDELEGDPPPAPSAQPEPDWTAIRIAKYRGLLRIAARDLLGRDFETSLRELTDLADRCLAAGLRAAARDVGAPAPSLLALGKLGGRELNFSSDVDLLLIHDPDGPDAEALPAATRIGQTLKRHLEAASEDGFGYRVDYDLRPEGTQGVLVNSVDAALDYYATYGAEWERQALMRLRFVAGPEAPAEQLCRELAGFIYPRLVDPGSIRQVHEMKLRIEAERRTAGRDLEYQLKEGPGGIRDVEFLVQALQRFQGGRLLELRTGNVLEALDALTRAGQLPEAVAAALTDGYLWLRRAEHAVQMVQERQTQEFPRDPAAQRALARRMGYADPEAEAARTRLLEDWTRVRAAVRQAFDGLVLAADA